MAEIVADCPLCNAVLVGFDICGDFGYYPLDRSYRVEALAVCRNCNHGSVAELWAKSNSQIGRESLATSGRLSGLKGDVSSYYLFGRFSTLSDAVARPAPEHLPESVLNCFREGASSYAIGCFNAAAAMFRLSLDIATKGLLPETTAEEGGPNSAQRKSLYARLEYLFEKRLIAPELRELADCVREDGNDGAHDGTLTKADAEDLIDFAEQLLERVYTEPARLRIAKARREARRAGEAAA